MRVPTCADEEGKVKKPRLSDQYTESCQGERVEWNIQEYILNASSNSNDDAFVMYETVKILRWS